MIGEVISKIRDAMSRESSMTADDVKELRRQVIEEREAQKETLDRLQRERRELLVTGTEEELVDHDEEIAAAETRLEHLQARAVALHARWKDLREQEDVDLMPERVARLGKAFDTYRKAETALARARGELEEVANEVHLAWGRVETKRPRDLAKLPVVPEGMKTRIAEVVGTRLRLPRPTPDPNEPRAIMQAGGGWRFEGDWTREDLRQFRRDAGPLPHDTQLPEVERTTFSTSTED